MNLKPTETVKNMINLQNNNILYGSDVAVPVPLGGINIKDESLGIDWCIPVEKAILSEKDLKHACLKDAVLDFDINDKLY